MENLKTKESKNVDNQTNPLEAFVEAGLQEGLSFKGELGELFEKAIDFCIEKRYI